MPTFDLRFPEQVRRPLAELAAMIADSGAASVLARTGVPAEDDPDFAAFWLAGLRERIEGDTAAALKLLGDPRFGTEAVVLANDDALAAVRGFTTLRLALRETALEPIPDEALETGRIDRRRLSPSRRHALACYGAFGEIQGVLCALLDDGE